MILSRRALAVGLGALAMPGAADTPAPAPPVAPAGRAPEELARDEGFWRQVARQYRVSPEITNLENGYYGIMPEPVLRAYHRNVDHLNERNSLLLRTTYKPRLEQIRGRVAAVLGASAQEIAFTRGGTEAMQNLIAGYRRLRPGDVVMYADLDYHSAQYAMNWLAERRGVRVVRMSVPEPATHEAVLDAYDRALRSHRRVRLLLVSHINNRTGLVLPVRRIVAMARAAGADVIVDAAHSWGQLDFTIDDLGADFAGFSLHKWMGVPLGAGFLYIRRGRLADVDRMLADQNSPANDIRSRVHSGTMNVAPFLTVGTALEFHHALGAAVKQARLRYLRDRWAHQVEDLPGVQILTPEDPRMYGAITAFRLAGRTSAADNIAIAKLLLDRYKIFTVHKAGPAKGACVRVTPALFTSRQDVDRLAAALHDLAGRLTRRT